MAPASFSRSRINQYWSTTVTAKWTTLLRKKGFDSDICSIRTIGTVRATTRRHTTSCLHHLTLRAGTVESTFDRTDLAHLYHERATGRRYHQGKIPKEMISFIAWFLGHRARSAYVLKCVYTYLQCTVYPAVSIDPLLIGILPLEKLCQVAARFNPPGHGGACLHFIAKPQCTLWNMVRLELISSHAYVSSQE